VNKIFKKYQGNLIFYLGYQGLKSSNQDNQVNQGSRQ